MKYVIALVVALVLNAAANLLMKVGATTVGQAGGLLKDGTTAGIKTILTSVPLVIGLACFGLNALCYIYALQSKTLQISIAYPIMVGGGYALIAVVAHWALAERLTWQQMTGVGLILVGVCLVAAQTQQANS